MRRRFLGRWALATSAWLIAAPATAGNSPCPSAGDSVYVVKDGDTLSDLARRFYEPADDPQLRATWEALHAYNKEAIGGDPDRFRHGSGTALCLPQRLSGPGWTRLRTDGKEEPGPQPPTTSSIPPSPSPEGDVAPAGPIPEPSGTPVKGADHSPNDRVDLTPEPLKDKEGASLSGRKSPLRRAVFGGMLGVMLPLSPALHDSLFREVGVALLELRFTVGPLEIAPRGIFVGGRDGTTYNQLEHPQTILGGGASLQLGVPIDLSFGSRGSLRIMPGIESGLLYIQRSIDPVSIYYQEQSRNIAVAVPLAGALARLEYAPPHLDGWKIALDTAGDILFAETPAADLSQSFTLTVLGGLGHAF